MGARRLFKYAAPAIALVLLWPGLASAAEPANAKVSVPDTVWVVITAMLVMFMQAGFAMVETGFTRAKNACNILMKNLMDFSVGSVVYWAVGFGVMFGAGNTLFGTSGWFLNDSGKTFESLAWANVPLEGKYFFQLVFCATAATIVSGAMAGRTKFVAYLVYSAAISAIIYPIVGHWIWGGGWLSNLGFADFAGSTVVHSVGGWLGLVGAIVLGARIGKYGPDRKARAIPGHNIPLAALGVFILWFGWFGFNPGSTMAAVPEIAHIAVTTNLATAAGAIGGMLTAWIIFKKPDISMTLNGALAGLVGITAPCAFVAAWAAVVIGLVAGALCVLSVLFLDRILKVDDPVGAVSVHGTCGVWGTLAVGLFGQKALGVARDGLFYGGGLKQLGVQAVGVVSVFAWCMVAGLALFHAIKFAMGLRVSKEEELRGLDVGEHGMEAYSGFQIFSST